MDQLEKVERSGTRVDRGRRRGRRRRRRVLWLAAAFILILGSLGGAALWLARADADRIPPEVTVGGVDVGGRTLEEARALLESSAALRVARRIRIVWEGGELRTSGKALKASPEIEQALADAIESRDGVDRLLARLGFGERVEIPLEFSVAEKRVRSLLRRVAAEVERAPVPPALEVVGSEVVVRSGAPGAVLDRQALADELSQLPASVELALRERAPTVSEEEAARARLIANAVIEQPATIVYRKRRLTLSRELLIGALRFERADGTLRVSLDGESLRRPLERAFGRFERQARDASFRIVGEKARVVASQVGRQIDVERTAAALVKHAGAARIRLLFTVAEPALTTRQAKGLGIKELVSEFTTPYSCCQPRVANIQLAAQILDGSIVKAGARFDLNKRLGRRTRERGFVPAPTIYDGRLVDDVGGGVSQIATTFYNAAFFAGLELIAHTPHQFYISRYPMGREATVNWGGPELIFRNDWPAGILVKVIATDTSITVRFYSSELGRRVETETGEPYDFREATVIRELNPELAPGTEVVTQSGGLRGFSVDYTRKVYRGKRLLRDEEFHVQYDPEDTVVEYGPAVTQPPPSETQAPPSETQPPPTETGQPPQTGETPTGEAPAGGSGSAPTETIGR